MGEVTDDGVVASCQPPLACRKGDTETSVTQLRAQPYPSHSSALDLPPASPSAGADLGGKEVPCGSAIPPQTTGLHQEDGARNNSVKTRGVDKLQCSWK